MVFVYIWVVGSQMKKCQFKKMMMSITGFRGVNGMRDNVKFMK